MNWGVPIAEPGSVSHEPLAEGGRSVASAESPKAVPTTFASPQSTTRVSPYWPDNDIAGLDVAVQYASAMRVSDRIADVEKSAEQLLELKRCPTRIALVAVLVEPLDGLLEAVAVDETHSVERSAHGVVAQTVDRDNARVL